MVLKLHEPTVEGMVRDELEAHVSREALRWAHAVAERIGTIETVRSFSIPTEKNCESTDPPST